MVAKTYQSLPLIGEPYTNKGRQYIKVATKRGEKEVRWYSDDEYYRMYPDETPTSKKTRTLKEVLGFEHGFITLLRFASEDFDENEIPRVARNNRLFGWHIASEDEVPTVLPPEITIDRLSWDDIAVDDDTLLKEDVVRRVVDGIRFKPSGSQHIGSVGDRIEEWVYVKKVMPIDGYYGRTYLHIFEDVNGNVYTWNTKTAHLTVDRWITLAGTISAHDEYRNEKQTKLVRCKVK
jgi:hypothetical protein